MPLLASEKVGHQQQTGFRALSGMKDGIRQPLKQKDSKQYSFRQQSGLWSWGRTTHLLCSGRKAHAAPGLLCFTVVIHGTRHIKSKGMEMQAGEDEPKYCRCTCFSPLILRKHTGGSRHQKSCEISPTPAVHGQCDI